MQKKKKIIMLGEIGAKRNQQQKSAFICTMICDSCTTCPPAPLLPLPLWFPLSSSGTRCDGVGRLPLSPGVCETLVRRVNGWPPSSTRSSTVDRWRWRRRTAQTSHRSEFPGTHRTAGHPARMASLPPATRGRNCYRTKLLPMRCDMSHSSCCFYYLEL